jgi:threonine synthase
MDISKASNFERFVHDLVGRDAKVVAGLWRRLDASGEFDLRATPYFAKLVDFGFVSGRSSHADRIATIRDVERRYGVVIDPHTADGVKAGLAHREPGVPLVCLETAQAAKFEATIREALGRPPVRPTEFADLEARPQRFDVIDPDVAAVRAYVGQHAAPGY